MSTQKNELENSFYRVQIRGTLTCLSPLHIGAGLELPLIDRDDEIGVALKKAEDNKKPADDENEKQKKDPDYLASTSGKEVQPIIPAASLRGSLLGGRNQQSKDVISRLFGCTKEDSLRAGKLQVFDATLKQPSRPEGDRSWSPTRKTILHQGISIEPITGTAANHHLFTFELVPSGSIFDIELVLQNLTETDIATTLGLLALWNGGNNSALGRGRSQGWGKVQWEFAEARALQTEDLQQWLKKPAESLEGFYKPLILEPVPIATNLATQSIPIWIKPDGPFLINQPSLCQDKPEDKKDGKETNDKNKLADLNFMRTSDGRALIPGSTLRGLIRARARRILASIAHLHFDAAPGRASEISDELIELLFGETGQRSPLWFEDAISDEMLKKLDCDQPSQDDDTPSKYTPHEQVFIAIDRFTGGVADGALYQVEAAISERLETRCHIETKRQPEGDWWKGLLLFVLRDALEGDLAVGWGKAKGYGKISAGLIVNNQDCTRFEEVLEHIKRDGHDPEDWVDALHATVRSTVLNEQEVTT